jgi:hypothetical protein
MFKVLLFGRFTKKWRCSTHHPQNPLFLLFLLGEDVACFVDDLILPVALPNNSAGNADGNG